MKSITLFLFVLFISGVSLSQQQIKGTSTIQGSGAYLTFDWSAEVSFYKKSNEILIKISNWNVQVSSNSKYLYGGKQYSKEQLGFSQWPCQDNSVSLINITLTINAAGKTITKPCSNSDGRDCLLGYTHELPNLNTSDCKVTSTSDFWVNGKGCREVEERILANQNQTKKENNSSTSSNSENSNSNSSSSSSSGNTNISNSSTSSAVNVPQLMSAEENMRQVGIDPNEDYIQNTLNYSSSMITQMYQDQQARIAREEKQQAELEALNYKKYLEARNKADQEFMEYYNYYYPLAEKLDIDAIQTLSKAMFDIEMKYLKSEYGDGYWDVNLERILPREKFYEWYQKLCDKNVVVACAQLAENLYIERRYGQLKVTPQGNTYNVQYSQAEKDVLDESRLIILYKAYKLGSIDATAELSGMLSFSSNDSILKFFGLNDFSDYSATLKFRDSLRFMFISKLANAGCEEKIKSLANIYLYGSQFEDSKNLNFKELIDYEKAFNLYMSIINKSYSPMKTEYGIDGKYVLISARQCEISNGEKAEIYKSLAKMYKEGLYVPIDLEKSKECMKMYRSLK